MISQTAVESVSPLLQGEIKCIKAMEGTPLAILTTSLRDSVVGEMVSHTEKQDAWTIDEINNLVSNSCRDCCQPEQLNAVVSKVTAVARNNIYIARNVILPLVESYTEVINERINENVNFGNLAIRVVADNNKNILNNTTLQDLVTRQSEYLGRTNTISALPEMVIENLEAALKTGHTTLDKTLFDWYKERNLSELLQTVYRKVFLKDTVKDIEQAVDIKDHNAMILILVLAKHFRNNIPEDVELSLQKYELNLDQIIATASRHISNAIKEQDRNVKQKQLIVKFPKAGMQHSFDTVYSGSNDIIVNGTIYNEYLASGGSVEAIIGNYLTSRKTSITDILSNQEEFKRAHDRALNIGKTTKTNKILTIVRNSLRTIGPNVYADIQAKVKSDDTSMYEGIKYDNTLFGRAITEFCNKIYVDRIDNIYTLVRDFICDIFFKESNVGSILRKMDRLDPNNEMDVNDVAIVAITDYITDWLMQQVVFGKPGEDEV